MAKAIRCDRCGVFFDDPGPGGIMKVTLQKAESCSCLNWELTKKDLCSQCYNTIKLFIEDPTVLYYSNAEPKKGESKNA